MAKQDINRVIHLPTEFTPRESQLFSLISVLCTTRNPRPKSDVCDGLMVSDTSIGGIITYRGKVNGQNAQEI